RTQPTRPPTRSGGRRSSRRRCGPRGRRGAPEGRSGASETRTPPITERDVLTGAGTIARALRGRARYVTHPRVEARHGARRRATRPPGPGVDARTGRDGE